MNLMRILIVDDETLARDRLRALLRQEPDLEIIGECANGEEALVAIRVGAPDLVFLDMQMPGGDGLQVVARLPEDRRPAIVFATAHEQYAVDAFDVAAVDYLLKPFDLDRLRLALQRARDHLQAR
ncbi:MAG TPA: response regulator, partial [Candidatus Polarisedimenticolia bacterium]|nr:response regulator [Candidatus Polarisedimenticolia bacterium]